MHAMLFARPLHRIPQSRVRREWRSIVRRDLPGADIQVTRCGAVTLVIISPSRLAELAEAGKQLAPLTQTT